jgi:aminoglycoside 3-N-acetyltransferase
MTNLPLYHASSGDLYEADLLKALKEVGVAEGDLLMVHSDIATFGKLALFDRHELCQALVNQLDKSIGIRGTLIMPTFSYSFCRNQVYNREETPSTVGVLTEFFRTQPGSVRTLHPIFSVAIRGPIKDQLLDVEMDCFGKQSIFGKVHAKRGKLLFFGATFQACTFIHYVEQMHGVPYRFIKTFAGMIQDGQRAYHAEATYLVRYLDRQVNLDLTRLEAHLLKKGMMHQVRVGNGKLLLVDADAVYQEGLKLLDQDIYFFLKEKPLEEPK